MGIEKGIVDWGAILIELETKKMALEQSIAGIRSAMALGVLGVQGDLIIPSTASSISMSGSISGSMAGQFDMPAGAFLGKSVPTAVALFLEAARAKKTTRQIAEALREGGIESESGNFENVVMGALFRLKKSGTVLRFKDGWGLSKWYPPGFRANGDPKSKVKKKRSSKKRSAEVVSAKARAQATTSIGARAAPSRQTIGPEAQMVSAFQEAPELEWTSETFSSDLGIKQKTVQMLLGKIVKRGLAQKLASGKYRGVTSSVN